MLKQGIYYICEMCGVKCRTVQAARRHRKDEGRGHILNLTDTREVSE